MTTQTETKTESIFPKLTKEEAIKIATCDSTQTLFDSIHDYLQCAGVAIPINTLTDMLHTYIESEEYEGSNKMFRSNRVHTIMSLIRFLPTLQEAYDRCERMNPEAIKEYLRPKKTY